MNPKHFIPRWMGDFWAFTTECLGYSRNDLGWSDLTQDHLDLCKFLQFDRHRSKLVLMPRYSLKSCVVTVSYALWNILRNPNIRILIYSDGSAKACGFLSDIKGHIKGGSDISKFATYFPDWGTEAGDGKWTESQILVSKREVAQKEPTVDTGGIETSKVGGHYDLILFDDIVTDLNITTKAQIEKTYDCYKKALSLLTPSGEVVMVGTRWAYGDTYGRIIDDNKDNDVFGIFLRKAVVNETYPFAAVGLTKEFLEKQKRLQGSYLWSVLYQNEPIDDSTSLFKHDDFRFYGDVETDNLYTTCTIDPAGEGEDYTGITVVGTDKMMRMHVLYCKHEHYKPSQIIEQIIRLSYGFKFKKLGIEGKIFNGMLERDLELRLGYERENPEFSPFGIEVFGATCRVGEGKNARILSLQPFHERGHLLFPGDTVEKLRGSFAELATQMMQYTPTHKPQHDDILDALSYQVQLINRGKGEAVKRPAPDTFIAIMGEDIKRHNQMQRKLPRRFRNYLEPVLR